MRANFDIGCKLTLNLEGKGKHTKDPDDPGGETYSGISRKYHPDWGGWIFIDKGDYKNADTLVKDFYRDKFWIPNNCDAYPYPFDVILFDSAVNPQNDPDDPYSANKEILNLMRNKANVEEFLLLRAIRYMKNSKPKYVKGHIFRVLRLYEQVREIHGC